MLTFVRLLKASAAACLSLAAVATAIVGHPHVVAAAPSLPASAMIEGVPHGAQALNLSCESRSAADLAAFWGVYVNELRFLAALPRSDNPHRGFVGDVNAEPGSLPPVGYGVYAEPVAALLRRFGLNAEARYLSGIEALRAELAAGRPVMVWATYGMGDHPVQEWVSSDGATSRIVRYEHTFVAVGYGAQGVYLADAYDGQVKLFPYGPFDAAWAKLGRMAVMADGMRDIAADDAAWTQVRCRWRVGAGWKPGLCPR